MSKDIKKQILTSYMNANVAPILVDFVDASSIRNATILPTNVSAENLIGMYKDTEYVAPNWYEELESNSSKVLLIDKIDSISKDEQAKFIEILKYRKVSTFSLPEDVVIVLTANKINKDTINEELYSLVAHVEG